MYLCKKYKKYHILVVVPATMQGRAQRQGRAPGASSPIVRPTSSSPSGSSTSCPLGLDQLSGTWNKAEPVRSMFRCNLSSGPTSSEWC